MADRNTLHRSKLDEFQNWLTGDGWTLEQTKGMFEVLRARKNKKVLIIYTRHSGDHLSYSDADSGVVRAFLNSRKSSKNMEKSVAEIPVNVDINHQVAAAAEPIEITQVSAKAVKCAKCGQEHAPDSREYLKITGNISIGDIEINGGGLIGNPDWDRYGIPETSFCLTGCFLTAMAEIALVKS